VEQYQQATLVAEGHTYNLADEIRAHLTALVLAEQREHEQQTGQRAPQARRRPKFKRKDGDGEHAAN
jgi:hypothetical protein